MATVKLTLSAEKSVVDLAKRLAAENGTSVSALFARLVNAMNEPSRETAAPIAPLTQQASGLIELPEGVSDAELLEAALMEKYGISP